MITFKTGKSDIPYPFKRPFWDEWGWAGVALGRLTVRLWWTGAGTVGLTHVTVFWPNVKTRQWAIGKYGLIHHVFSAGLYGTYARDYYSHIFQVRLGRAEVDLCLYKIAPAKAQPDLWE